MMFRELEEKAEKVSNILLKQEKWHTIKLKQKKELFVKKFPVYTHQNGKLKKKKKKWEPSLAFIQDD